MGRPFRWYRHLACTDLRQAGSLSYEGPAMNPDLRRRTDELCSRLTQLRDSL
jgi:hypothetical protein